MKMRKVMAAWAVIIMVMVTAAFAQRPEPARPMDSPPFMGFMGRTENCRVMMPNGARQNTFVCRCYMNPQGFNCMILPRATAMAMDSMREGRMRMGNDSMRQHMDSFRARRPLGRRPNSM